jgi:T-complex protein 1 subunit eta
MDIAVDTAEGNQRDTLQKLAATAMNSKLIHRNSKFFTKMVVDAVLSLDQDELNEKLIGVKKITGGALQDSLFVNGVAFKKTFSYAGFEQQPKSFKNPKIVCLNVELELKSEKDNAEVRVEQVSEYQAIVDAEWQIIYNKMEALYKTGAKIVLSKLPIGDLATQFFADRDVFCAGRVASDDLDRVCRATGASVQSTCTDIQPKHLGTCESFDERQIGGERFNFFEGCPEAKTCTLVLRGGAEQFIAEVERSLHDAIMIVKRAIKNRNIVAGGGAVEMEISSYLHNYADKNIPHKQQPIIKAFAKALEVIPRQLCDNAGVDATDILNRLRVEHKKGNVWAGVDFTTESIANNMEKFVWEPSLVKVNALQAATEAACLILSVDETISKCARLRYRGRSLTQFREPRVTAATSTEQAAAARRSTTRSRNEGPRKRYAQEVERRCLCGMMSATTETRTHMGRPHVYDNARITNKEHHRIISTATVTSTQSCHLPSPLLPTHPITLHPAPIKRSIILQPKLAPIIRQPIITPIPLPTQLVILRAPSRRAQTQHHLVHVLWRRACRFHNQCALLLRLVFTADLGTGQAPPA